MKDRRPSPDTAFIVGVLAHWIKPLPTLAALQKAADALVRAGFHRDPPPIKPDTSPKAIAAFLRRYADDLPLHVLSSGESGTWEAWPYDEALALADALDPLPR